MKFAHFNAYKPLCPRCRAAQSGEFPLNVGFTLQDDETEILSGALVCSNPACQCEYPIIDGIPYLFADIRKYLGDHHLEILLRDDLPAELQGMLHETAGGQSWLGSHRQYLSSYMFDHYENGIPTNLSGNIVNLVQKAYELTGLSRVERSMEIGCSVGRGTFELAQLTGGLALGVDVNPLMLRKAAQAMRHGKAVYDLRRGGMLYERREILFEHHAASRVDFWAADGLALPFSDRSVDCVMAMNVLDCVASPVGMLNEIVRIMGKAAGFCSPWDWTSSVTPEENWIGGHSPRSNLQGNSLELIKTLIPTHLNILGEIKNLPWKVRMHDRHTADYQTDLIVIGI